MEKDRYQVNHSLFFVSLMSMLLAVDLFFFSVFVFPYLILHFRYDVPEIITYSVVWFTEYLGFTERSSGEILFFLLFISFFIFAGIATLTSRKIDRFLYQEDAEMENANSSEMSREVEGGTLVTKKLLVYFWVLFIVEIFLLGVIHWVISG